MMYLIDTFFTISTGLIYMYNKNSLLTLFVFLPLPILSIIIFRVSRLINKKSTVNQEHLSALTSNAQESFSGIRVIKSYNKESFFTKLFSMQALEYRNAALSLARTEAMFHPVITFMIGLVSFVARQTAKNLSHKGYDVNSLNDFWVDSQAYILMAGVIYAIAMIFKRGIEIQNENDSTI